MKNKIIDLDKAREHIFKLICKDAATFTFNIKQREEFEFVNVVIEYSVCGVLYEKEKNLLKLIININSQTPLNVWTGKDELQREIRRNIAAQFNFLLRGTFDLSINEDSISSINKKGELLCFREEMEQLIKSKGYLIDEVLPILIGYIQDNVSNSSFGTMEELVNNKNQIWPVSKECMPIMEIIPPGVPCPHCSGILDRKALFGLLNDFHMRFRRGDDFDC